MTIKELIKLMKFTKFISLLKFSTFYFHDENTSTWEHEYDKTGFVIKNYKGCLKGYELVASVVTASKILFKPIQTELVDFLTSLTDGRSGEGGVTFEVGTP